MGDIKKQEYGEMIQGENHYGTQRLSFLFICMLAALAPAAQAGSLGRLFFTPEQRAQLEHQRAHNITAEARSTASMEKSSTETAEESDTTSVLMVNGIVQKHGGPRTVWINGMAQNAGNSGERTPESLTVTVPGKTQSVRIKVGQKLLLANPAQHRPAEQKPAKAGSEDD